MLQEKKVRMKYKGMLDNLLPLTTLNNLVDKWFLMASANFLIYIWVLKRSVSAEIIVEETEPCLLDSVPFWSEVMLMLWFVVKLL